MVRAAMRFSATFNRRETIILVLLATTVLAAVTYGVVTYQTQYGCSSDGVAQGLGVDLQVLAKPCIYIYFTGIVGGSTLLILLIPVSKKKPIPSATPTDVSNENNSAQVPALEAGSVWT